jgi:hypothetical protein
MSGAIKALIPQEKDNIRIKGPFYFPHICSAHTFPPVIIPPLLKPNRKLIIARPMTVRFQGIITSLMAKIVRCLSNFFYIQFKIKFSKLFFCLFILSFIQLFYEHKHPEY